MNFSILLAKILLNIIIFLESFSSILNKFILLKLPCTLRRINFVQILPKKVAVKYDLTRLFTTKDATIYRRKAFQFGSLTAWVQQHRALAFRFTKQFIRFRVGHFMFISRHYGFDLYTHFGESLILWVVLQRSLFLFSVMCFEIISPHRYILQTCFA